jgi:hypothetical protein
MFIEVGEKDFKKLVEVIKYVISREGEVVDTVMVEHLHGVLSEVVDHVKNERFGRVGGRASGVAMQIDAVLPLFGGNRGEGE